MDKIKPVKLDNLYVVFDFTSGKLVLALDACHAIDNYKIKIVPEKSENGKIIATYGGEIDSLVKFKLTDIIVNDAKDTDRVDEIKNIKIANKLLVGWANLLRTEEIYDLFNAYYKTQYDALSNNKLYIRLKLQTAFMLPLMQEYSKLACKKSANKDVEFEED